MAVRHPMSRGVLDTDLTIKGNWTFTGVPTFSGNLIVSDADLIITGATAANKLTFSHDDTDFNLTSANTGIFNMLESDTLFNLISTSDAGLATAGHPFQVGLSSGLNLRMDNNEFMAVNNGAASTLFLNADGGEVNIGNATSADLVVSGDITMGDTQALKNSVGGELRISRLSLTDDATGTVTVGNRSIIMVTAGFDESAGLAALITFVRAPIFFHTLGAAASYGNSANPDVDGDANYWKSSNTALSIKNRLGSTRTFTIYDFADS